MPMGVVAGPPSALIRLRKGTAPALLGIGERDVVGIEGLGIIGIIVLGMPLQPGNCAGILGMTGVAEDGHQALISWHTATVLRRTGACACETARVLDAFVLQQDALQH